ncbi:MULTISPECIES: hypothetical protein [Enterococcus]|nr:MULTISPECIES: hypothetical protein [Enterococcus]MCD5019853.1 hypothetical protein [Enterococcus faecium]MDK4344396.1 hypothetical protein [Enterococcus faecium]MDK4377994.1 hypothetical protein [Enterococcus faecium]MDT2357574.1 hypothetical protein [Enterococcus faecium]OXC92698.1 hypothetical protein CBL16_14595 [Enterococcus faecalis]
MNLEIIEEAAFVMNEAKHRFTGSQKEFVVQFAFKTANKDLTSKLIEELRQSENETQSAQIIQNYSAMIQEKPNWVAQIENLLVALEMYRIEEEKAINRLTDILSAYGISVSVEEIRQTDTEELLTKVKKETMEVR